MQSAEEILKEKLSKRVLSNKTLNLLILKT